MDKGPWRLLYDDAEDSNPVGIASDDFSRDVVLYVTGDFADNDERRRYCEWLRDALNKATANPEPACDHAWVTRGFGQTFCDKCGAQP